MSINYVKCIFTKLELCLNMRRTFKIIFFILKIKKKFYLPKKNSIIVWDKEASEDLRYCINLKKLL